MRTLLDELSARVGAAFEAEGLDPALGQVRVSDRPDLAEFQCNGALAAAKAAKANPREIAGKIADRLKTEGFFAKVEIAGPGFLNLDLDADFLTARTRAVANSERAGGWRTETPRTVIVDYGGPNIAKPMHVGHLRSSIIGESVKRLFAYVGDRAVGDIHLGDWGLPMGMLISELEIRHPDWPYFIEGARIPDEPPFTMDALETVYPEAASACKGDAERLERARATTAALQAGKPGYRALWKAFVDVTRARLEAEFAALGVSFELWKGEADVDPLIAPMAEAMRAKGVLVESDGAEVIHVGEDGEAKEIPPLIVFKSDGAVTYGTTDLATIVDRAKDPAPDLSLYVVDHRQSLHFEQVFRAAAKAGLAEREALEHLAYGTMNGPDGKPFKTRAGGVMKLRDLLAQMTEAARARLAEAGLAEGYGEEEIADIARKVGLAAVKFADLSHDRTSNYVFDVDRFTRFEGKTGPYLLYAAVRIQSLMRKAGAGADLARAPMIKIEAPEERALALALCAFADMSRQAYERRAPNVLCDHAYALAQAYSSFYAACPVLSAKDDQVMASRLALSKAALAQLTAILGLLGLEAPERM